MKKLTPETARKHCETAENAFFRGDDWTPELGDLVTFYALDFAPVLRAFDDCEIEKIEVSHLENKADYTAAHFVELRACGVCVSVAFVYDGNEFPSALLTITNNRTPKTTRAAFYYAIDAKGGPRGYLDESGDELGDFIKSWISTH